MMVDSIAIARHSDTLVSICRDDVYVYSASREGSVRVSMLESGALHHVISGLGALNCLSAHRGKLLVCSDDGHHATLQIWDVPSRRLVQEVGGIRKWNAPTAVCYMGYEKAFWVRDAMMCTLRWRGGEAPATPPIGVGDEGGPHPP
jgi:hypothetical protein